VIVKGEDCVAARDCRLVTKKEIVRFPHRVLTGRKYRYGPCGLLWDQVVSAVV
jgi:hypothetical protein